jgi:sugar O-acyltransferase (sialic acid O-acetyltransferase NeuD family)
VTPLLGVYGASGCGRGVMPIVRAEHRAARLVFIDDASTASEINGCPIMSWAAFCADPAEKKVTLAIANSRVRERLAEQSAAAGISLFEARAANVVVMDDVEIGEGAVLSPFVTLTSNIRIGRCFHANLYSYVEHDCVLGDFVTFAPGAKCNGNIVIEDHAYIGAGAILRQGRPGRPLTIGRGAVVGMGAVVTRDVPAGTTVVGIPARELQRNNRC